MASQPASQQLVFNMSIEKEALLRSRCKKPTHSKDHYDDDHDESGNEKTTSKKNGMPILFQSQPSVIAIVY